MKASANWDFESKTIVIQTDQLELGQYRLRVTVQGTGHEGAPCDPVSAPGGAVSIAPSALGDIGITLYVGEDELPDGATVPQGSAVRVEIQQTPYDIGETYAVTVTGDGVLTLSEAYSGVSKVMRGMDAQWRRLVDYLRTIVSDEELTAGHTVGELYDLFSQTPRMSGHGSSALFWLPGH